MAKRNPVPSAADANANVVQSTQAAAPEPTKVEPTKVEPAIADDSLTPTQRQAIESLSRGRSFKSAASAAGINRRTLYRWLHEDHAFRAAYYSWKAEIQESARARLLSLANAAVAAMGHAIHKRDARAATALLKGLSILSPNAPGPEDPLESQRLSELDRVTRDATLMERENAAWDRQSTASGSLTRYYKLRENDPRPELPKLEPMTPEEEAAFIREIEGEEEDGL